MPYALITGASKGIGRAIAFELAKRNYDLLLTSRSLHLLNEAAEEIKKIYPVKIHFIAIDLSDNNAPKKLYEWCIENNYPVSILINNAGAGMSGLFQSSSLENNTRLIYLNVLAPTQLCQLFIPLFEQHSQSYILNIASTASYQAIPHLAVYASCKAYLQKFSRSLSYELSRKGISVTCISPGPTDTDWAKNAAVPAKALKMAEKLNMHPSKVAQIALDSMFAKKTEVVPGFVNKFGVFLAWLFPKKVSEKVASRLYEQKRN
ncbi:MAG: SDR family NAD(P)-dependent oxidoreductase [Ginsengibacter sp.]